MDEKWQALHTGLLDDLSLLNKNGHAGPGQTESCFKCCLRYWEECKAMARDNGFGGDEGEIRFFRYVKPLMTGQLEYYSLVYQYQLFHPAGDARELAAFRQRERNKIDRFHLTHAAFIGYCHAGDTYNDHRYFLRSSFDPSQVTYVRPFDRDPEFWTAADWILTLLTGNDLYERFLTEKEDEW